MVTRHRHENYWLYAGTQPLACRHRITSWLFSAIRQQNIVWSYKLLIQEYSWDREVSEHPNNGGILRMIDWSVSAAPPFTVSHYKIKWSKGLTQWHNHLKLNMPCSSSARTNTNSYGLAARQLKAEKYKRYRDFAKKCPYRFFRF